MVFVDPIAFKWGWMGSAQRYFQMGRALADLGWKVSIVTRRDNRTLHGAKEARRCFPGEIFVTPFGTFPAVIDHRGLRHAWRLARQWSRRELSPDQRWSESLVCWEKRFSPQSPLASADLLCGVGYRHWESLAATRLLAEQSGIPYWLDLQDPLEGTGDVECPPLSEERLLSLRGARRIVTTTESYAARLRQLVPDIADNIVCLRMTRSAPPPADAQIPTSSPQGGATPGDTLVILHAGYLYGLPDRSAVPLLRGLAQLYEKAPLSRGKVKIRLLGQGPGMSEALAEARLLALNDDIEIRPPVDPEGLRPHLQAADVLCVLKAARKTRDYQMPGKTYDYLFSDKPILAVTYPGELSKLVEQAGAGYVVSPDDPGMMATTFGALLAQKQVRGSVAMPRDPAKLRPYSFETFSEGLGTILGACIEKERAKEQKRTLEQAPVSPIGPTEIHRFVYFAPADVQVARVDRNCIVKFCEALAEEGAEVILVAIGIRVLSTEPTKKRSIWDVYGVERPFKIITIRLPLRQQNLGARASASVIKLTRSLVYPAVALRLALQNAAPDVRTVFYCKNPGLVPGLALVKSLRPRRVRILFEAHVPPRNRFQRWALRKVDGVVCNGEAVRDSMVRHHLIEAKRSLAVQQGCNLGSYPSGARAELRAHARSRLGWPNGERVVVYTGKVSWPSAEVELLLQTAEILAPENTRMVMVGGRADSVQRWRDTAGARGIANASFVGFVAPAEIPHYQLAADVLVSYYPSTTDHIEYVSPGKLFEYMAAGAPIVAADFFSLREVLRDGENALLVEPDRPDALAVGLRRVLEDPRLAGRLGEQAREDARQFTWKARAKSVEMFVSDLEMR